MAAEDEDAQRQTDDPADNCVMISTMRLLKRSEITPASGASTRIGPNCRPVVMPTAIAELSVSTVSTSQSWATRCIQVPVFEMMAPAAHIR